MKSYKKCSTAPLFCGTNDYLTRGNGKYKCAVVKGRLEVDLVIIINDWSDVAGGIFGLKRY